MMRRNIVGVAWVVAGVGAGVGVGACSERAAPASPPPAVDTSYLDSLDEADAAARPGGAKGAEEGAEGTAADGAGDVAAAPEGGEVGAAGGDEGGVLPMPEPTARVLVPQRESRSILGRSRDLGVGAREAMSGGSVPSGSLAEMTSEDLWIGFEGLRWEIDEAWQLVIPRDASILAEVFIDSELGGASVYGGSTNEPAAALVRRLGSAMLDDVGQPQRARPRAREIGGVSVQTVAVSGTFVDPTGRVAGENPFWALRVAAFERDGRPTAYLMLVGPEQTVQINEERWEAMLGSMTAR